MRRVGSLISKDLASLGIRKNNGTGIIHWGTPKMTRSGDWAKNKITKNNQVRGLGSFSYRVPGGGVIVAFCCAVFQQTSTRGSMVPLRDSNFCHQLLSQPRTEGPDE